jgi:membrane-anchored protein YejM (alkaline phosphatase superfamily)
MQFMPKTLALLGDEGTTYANISVSLSLCCPAHSTFRRSCRRHRSPPSVASDQRRAESVMAVDERVGTIVEALAEAGKLDNTIVMVHGDPTDPENKQTGP